MTLDEIKYTLGELQCDRPDVLRLANLLEAAIVEVDRKQHLLETRINVLETCEKAYRAQSP